MKSCPSCKVTDLPDKTRFCPECGTAVVTVVAPPEPEKPTLVAAPRAPEEAPVPPTPSTVPSPTVGMGGLYVDPMVNPKKKGKFSETLWFKEGEDLSEEEVAAERYLRTGATPDEVRQKFSLNPDQKPKDEDILP